MSSRKSVIPFSKSFRGPPSTRPICFSNPSSATTFKTEPVVCFHRKELNLILSYYGKMVSNGSWRDYALDLGGERAVFSIFRHSAERPLYCLEKHPKLAQKQGAFLVRNDQGIILKRGKDLKQVLKVFDKKITANNLSCLFTCS